MNKLFFESRLNLFDLISIFIGLYISTEIGAHDFLGGAIFLMIWCIVSFVISVTGVHWSEFKEIWNDSRGKSDVK